MAAISSVNSVAATQQINPIDQLQQKQVAHQQKAQQNQAPQDTVHLSKAALAALGTGDVNNDGDHH